VQLLALVVGVLDGDVEHLGEVLPEAVRRAALDSATGGGDEALDGGGVEAAGELLLLRLDSGDDGNGEKLLVDATVQLEDLEDLGVGFGLGLERRVALLPEELARAEEGFWGGEEESDHVGKNRESQRVGVRGFLNSHRTTEFHWLSFRGRSR
jgi:hypothetical protein